MSNPTKLLALALLLTACVTERRGSGDDEPGTCAVTCGSLCCGAGERCDAGTTRCVASTGCVKKTCAGLNKNCGGVDDGCGGTMQCGSCVPPFSCAGGGLANVCGNSACTPERDDAMCARLAKNCGELLAFDNCGTARRVLTCGGCQGSQTCGGQIPNVCGNQSCVPESDQGFCSRLGKQCGQVIATDNCGFQRSLSSCGNCPYGTSCGGGGTTNRCGSAGELVLEFTFGGVDGNAGLTCAQAGVTTLDLDVGTTRFRNVPCSGGGFDAAILTGITSGTYDVIATAYDGSARQVYANTFSQMAVFQGSNSYRINLRGTLKGGIAFTWEFAGIGASCVQAGIYGVSYRLRDTRGVVLSENNVFCDARPRLYSHELPSSQLEAGFYLLEIQGSAPNGTPLYYANNLQLYAPAGSTQAFTITMPHL